MKWPEMKRDSSVVLLGAMVWFVGLGAVVPYLVMGAPLSGVLGLSVRLWVSLTVVLWVARDMRARHCDPWFEYTAFVFVAWPVMLPHYLIRSRGRHGALLTLAFYSPAIGVAFLYGVARLLLLVWPKS